LTNIKNETPGVSRAFLSVSEDAVAS